jgi:hypothetical protein
VTRVSMDTIDKSFIRFAQAASIFEDGFQDRL